MQINKQAAGSEKRKKSKNKEKGAYYCFKFPSKFFISFYIQAFYFFLPYCFENL